MAFSNKGDHESILRRAMGITVPRSLAARIEPVMLVLGRVDGFLTQAADRTMYDFFFRRSVFTAIVLIISFNLILDILLKNPALEDNFPPSENKLLNISPHTLIVLNAVPRTSLAQKRVKVPIIKEVSFAIEEIDIPEPEFGAVDIGPDRATPDGGTGGRGGLPYRRPELVMLVPPVYPKDAEKKGIEGTVDMRILVTERGTVDEVEISQSSGNSSMDEAAVRAAKRTRFRPAIKDGQRVAMWINYPIQFALAKKRN
jgi:TonB family protein